MGAVWGERTCGVAVVLALTLAVAGGLTTARAGAAEGLAGPRAAEQTLTSGSLEAIVDADPFRVHFRDRTSGRVLSTLGGALPSPTDPQARYGPLGYSFDLRIPVINNAFLGY